MLDATAFGIALHTKRRRLAISSVVLLTREFR